MANVDIKVSVNLSIALIFKKLHDKAIDEVKLSGFEVINSAIVDDKFLGPGQYTIIVKKPDNDILTAADALKPILTYILWFSGPDTAKKIAEENLLPMSIKDESSDNNLNKEAKKDEPKENNNETNNANNQKEENTELKKTDNVNTESLLTNRISFLKFLLEDNTENNTNTDTAQSDTDTLNNTEEKLDLTNKEENTENNKNTEKDENKEQDANSTDEKEENVTSYGILYTIKGIKGAPFKKIADTLKDVLKAKATIKLGWNSLFNGSNSNIGSFTIDTEKIYDKLFKETDPEELKTKVIEVIDKDFKNNDLNIKVETKESALKLLSNKISKKVKAGINSAKNCLLIKVDKNDKYYSKYNTKIFAEYITKAWEAISSNIGLFKKGGNPFKNAFKELVKADDVYKVENIDIDIKHSKQFLKTLDTKKDYSLNDNNKNTTDTTDTTGESLLLNFYSNLLNEDNNSEKDNDSKENDKHDSENQEENYKEQDNNSIKKALEADIAKNYDSKEDISKLINLELPKYINTAGLYIYRDINKLKKRYDALVNIDDIKLNKNDYVIIMIISGMYVNMIKNKNDILTKTLPEKLESAIKTTILKKYNIETNNHIIPLYEECFSKIFNPSEKLEDSAEKLNVTKKLNTSKKRNTSKNLNKTQNKNNKSNDGKKNIDDNQENYKLENAINDSNEIIFNISKLLFEDFNEDELYLIEKSISDKSIGYALIVNIPEDKESEKDTAEKDSKENKNNKTDKEKDFKVDIYIYPIKNK